MRRASTCLAVLGLAVLGLPATASAAPTVTLKAKAVPIPGFPHTGNILGAGAAREGRIHDHGDRIRWLPGAADRGQLLSCPQARNCTRRVRRPARKACSRTSGPSGCPKKSKLARSGSASGVVSFGTERVRRGSDGAAVLRPRRQPAVLCAGHFARLDRNHLEGPLRQRLARRSARQLLAEVPLIESVPGALDASTEYDQREGRRRVQEGQEDGLLRHGAEEVPEGRLPAEVGNGIRGMSITPRYRAKRRKPRTRRRAPRSSRTSGELTSRGT